MLGAIAVAAISAWLTLREARWYLGPSYQLATGIHRRFFGGLIALDGCASEPMGGLSQPVQTAGKPFHPGRRTP
jgi:hypothetical protein